MRIVAGEAGGRKLVAPEGDQTRPTSERVREAVFNALFSQGLIEDARVLDMFAGSGALGLEAVSRGAESAVFIDSSRRAARAIDENIAMLGWEDRTQVITADTMGWLKRQPDGAPRGLATFDLALCDPPYAFDEWDTILARTPAAILVIESSKDAARDIERTVAEMTTWGVLRSRRYGGTVVTMLERRHSPQEGDASAIEENKCESSNKSSTD